MFKNIIENLFLGNKWNVVHSTQDIEEHTKIRGKLMDATIEMKTKMNNRNVSNMGRDREMNGRRMTTYNILVKVEEVNKANDVIHHR
ncbi:hypothetical protein IZY60_05015 [Lutibacter sp. B2]|nr:hypothetical protein [Lutibacter sp. B2]